MIRAILYDTIGYVMAREGISYDQVAKTADELVDSVNLF